MALEDYVYKFHTKRGFWSLVENSGKVTIVDHDYDDAGEFVVVMFHDAEIAQDCGVHVGDDSCLRCE